MSSSRISYVIIFVPCIFWAFGCALSSDWNTHNYKVSMLQESLGSSLVENIGIGVQSAMEECKNSFKWDKWNCPQAAFSKRNNPLLTKETGYVLAITSAGIVHTLAKSCSKGEIEGCGCDKERAPLPTASLFKEKSPPDSKGEIKEVEWSWGGCSEDISNAISVANKYLDQLPKSTTPAESYVIKHNTRLGQNIVQQTMVKTCRCHGASGSCSLRTCWMQAAPLSEIARNLKDRYKRALPVNYDLLAGGNGVRSFNEKDDQNKFDPNVLTYLAQSPDYCLPDPSSDWPGTKGRVCSRSRHRDPTNNDTTTTTTTLKVGREERKSCRNVCRSCGYRVKKQKRTVMGRCNCTFIWCCQVECDTCEQVIEEHFCE